MPQIISAARWDAVSALQSKRHRYDVNALEYHAADHAISLALSERRQANMFLAANANRDARKIILRSRKKEQTRFPQPLYGTSAAPESLDVRHEQKRSIDGTYTAALSGTPEHDRIWRDFYEEVKAKISQNNRYAAPVLDAWRDGESVEDTAAYLKISAAYVKKLRRLIADQARAMDRPV